MNQAILMGRLTRDPELRYTTSGTQVVRFTVAVDRQLSREKKQELESRNQPTADFINVVAWGRLAETVARYTEKGKRVMVSGRIQTGSYQTQDGQTRYTTEIVANSVEFIDWKDSSSSDYSGQNTGNQQNKNDSREDDDYFGDGFSPIDDNRIPF